IELADQTIARDHSVDAHDIIPASWCKSRLLMHAGICAVRDKNWSEAMRLLGDSDACLNYFDPRRQGTDRAVVELHRAEVRLREAEEVVICEKSDGFIMTFSTMCQKLSVRESKDSLLWRSAGDDVRLSSFHDWGISTKAGPALFEAKLTRVKALVQDALRF